MQYVTAAFFLLLGACQVSAIPAPDYESGWFTITSQQGSSSYKKVTHGLNAVPIRVQVLVKASGGNNNGYMFEAMGSSMRDDDSSTTYGGITYSYSTTEVHIYAPDKNNEQTSGRAICTGATGWTSTNSQTSSTAYIKVRVWSSCNFPPPDWVTGWFNFASHAGSSSYTTKSHTVGSTPALVILQAKLEESRTNLYVDGMGATQADQDGGSMNWGGIVYGFNSNTIRVWAPSGSSYHGYAAYIGDGWAGETMTFAAKKVKIRISAWKASSLGTLKSTHDVSMGVSGEKTQLSIGSNSWDRVLAVVQTQAKDGNNNGYRFNGMGGAMGSGQYGGKYGGVIWAHNGNNVRLWRPTGSNGYIINIGKHWGAGSKEQHSKTGTVVIRVYDLSTSKSNVCTPGSCSTGSLGATCSCTGTGYTGTACKTKASCSAPPNIANAAKSGSTYTYQSTVTYSCNTGYQKSSGSTSRTCGTGLTWSGSNLVCAKVSCGNPGNIANAAKSGSSYVYQAKVTYSCNTGYETKSGSTSRTCGSNKAWSGSALVCGKVSCGNPGTVALATKSGSSYLYQDKVTYTCQTGHDVKSGNAQRTCGSNKAWSGSKPVCGKVSCGNAPAASNTKVTSKTYVYQDKATYTCNSGYEKKAGDFVLTCGANKQFSGTKVTCGKVSCGDPGTVAQSSKSGTSYLYQDSVTYTCTSGYEIKSGNAKRTCQAGKTWSGAKPVCGKIGCADPGVSAGTQRTGTSFTFGDSLTYSCKTGWTKSSGTSVITCSSNKQWSAQALKCQRVSCGSPGNIVNGTLHGNSFVFESVVNVTCVTGYEIKTGSSSRECQSDKTWTGTKPSCGKVQCPLALGAGVQVSVGAKSTYEFMDQVTLACKTGYLVSGGNTTGHCRASGSWLGASLTCSNIDDCSPNPCQNGAGCTDGVNDYTCSCTSGYSGKTCNTRVTTTQNILAALQGRGSATVKPALLAFLLLVITGLLLQ